MMKLSLFYLFAYEHSYRVRHKLSLLFSEDELPHCSRAGGKGARAWEAPGSREVPEEGGPCS